MTKYLIIFVIIVFPLNLLGQNKFTVSGFVNDNENMLKKHIKWKKKKNITHEVIFDRIELGTYMIAAALVGKKIIFDKKFLTNLSAKGLL